MKSRHFNLIQTGIALLGVIAVFTASASRADGPVFPQANRNLPEGPVTSLPYPDLQPTVNPNGGGVLDWVYINGQPNLRVWIRNVGIAVAPPSLVGVSFINPSKTINIVATLPAIMPGATVSRLVAAPFTNIGYGPALAIHADVNHVIQELNETNNDLYVVIPKLEPVGNRN